MPSDTGAVNTREHAVEIDRNVPAIVLEAREVVVQLPSLRLQHQRV